MPTVDCGHWNGSAAGSLLIQYLRGEKTPRPQFSRSQRLRDGRLRTPPFLAIEILSKTDRKRSQEGWGHTIAGAERAKDGILRTQNTVLEMSLPEIFAALR